MFNFPLDRFYGEMTTKLSFMRRDQDEFIKYGIDPDKLDQAEAELEEFADMPTDEELLGLQVTATQHKDALAENVRTAISAILVRVANKFGEGSGRYKMFGVNGLAHLEGWSLGTSARRVARVAGSIIGELESEGLTAEDITALTTLKNDYKTALDKQEDAIAKRDIASEDRIEKANAIYRAIAKYCGTGMKLWQATNEARYNDYVMYGSASPGTNEEGQPQA